jgi:hypothetical protein
MKPKFSTEAELAKVVTTWLRADGWATFHEVECWGGRADIVAVRHGLVWLVETKLRAGLEVLSQALDKRRAGAHGVLVAVPIGPAARLLAGVAHRLGVGVIAVSEVAELVDEGAYRLNLVHRHQAEMLSWPDFYRQAKAADLLRGCKPEHAAQPAGTTGTKIWTPFKAAVRAVIYQLAGAPEHHLLVSELALGAAVREYKRGFEAAQLRRWLCQAIQQRPQQKGAALPGFFPACSLMGRGKARAVILDVAGLTQQHRRDYQLDELDKHLNKSTC